MGRRWVHLKGNIKFGGLGKERRKDKMVVLGKKNIYTEMEFFNGIFRPGFLGINSCLFRLEFLPSFLPSFLRFTKCFS
jgi:hypothetical protein